MDKPWIAVDAMGGDAGPEVTVPGALDAVRSGAARVLLVGDEDVLKKELDRHGGPNKDVRIIHATEVVGMDEKPSEALRRKKDSSIKVACRLVKDGQAGGVISAGNSGASVACGVLTLGRIKGVERPALAGIMPSEKNPVIFIDVGANVDSKAHNLVQFGIMADVLARQVLGIPDPRIGLLTIGEEEGKGNTLVKTAFDLFRKSSLNFIGNLEGRDIFTGNADVIVCDGFVGNVALKLSEGLAKTMSKMLKQELGRDIASKIGAMLAMRAFRRFSRMMDPNEYGGAPLLGLRGIVLVCHGKSSPKAIERAVEMAAAYVRNNALGQLTEILQENRELASLRRASKEPSAA